MEKTSIENNTLYIAIGSLKDYGELLKKKSSAWMASEIFVSIDEMKDRYAVEGQDAGFLEEASEKIVLSRIKEGLTTFYHYGEEIRDSKVLELIGHSKRHGMKYKVITLNTEYKKKYFLQEKISRDTVFVKSVNEIQEDNIDVIGDIHGCFIEMKALLQNMGYSLATGIPVHPENRKIVWLGDLIDRGLQSIETLKMVKNSVEKGGHYCIRGNHEEYLLKSFNVYKRSEPVPAGEGVKRTLVEFLIEFNEEERTEYVAFINSLPYYLIKEYQNGAKFALVHGNLKSFDPYSTLRSSCVFGSDDELDDLYEEGYLSGRNKYTLIRGHISQDTCKSSVYSLEDNQSFSGDLMAIKLDDFKEDVSIDSFGKNVKKQRVSFNYIQFKKRDTLLKRIKEEEREGFVKRSENRTRTLFAIGYDKKANTSKSWKSIPFHKKIKNIVIDSNGHIAQRSFDHIDDDKESGFLSLQRGSHYVDIVPCIKGELYSVSLHPFEKTLLITNGKSEIVDLVPSLKKESKIEILSTLAKITQRATLIFKHVYSEKGESLLYLVGARDNTLNSKLYKEELLDALAKNLNVLRPKIEYNFPFQEALKKAKMSNGQNYIFRDGTTKKYLVRVSA